MDLNALRALLGGGGLGGPAAATDGGQTDTAETVYISSLALLKVSLNVVENMSGVHTVFSHLQMLKHGAAHVEVASRVCDLLVEVPTDRFRIKF
jgi:hypothetical protein